jgi:hypothetical protein
MGGPGSVPVEPQETVVVNPPIDAVPVGRLRTLGGVGAVDGGRVAAPRAISNGGRVRRRSSSTAASASERTASDFKEYPFYDVDLRLTSGIG